MTNQAIIKPNAIIFDMDGTLYSYDTPTFVYPGSTMQKLINSNKIKILEQYGVKNIPKILELMGNSPLDTSEFISQYLGVNLENIINQKMDFEGNFISMDEELIEFLKKIKSKNIKMFVVTGSPTIWSDKCLKILGVENYFEKIYNNGYYPNIKKKYYEEILLENTFSPNQILVVGDSVKNDIDPAKTLGISTIFCTRNNIIEKLNLWQ